LKMPHPYPMISISIDRGGTFTDVVATVEFESGAQQIETCKLLSVDPEHYPDAPSEGIRRIIARCVPTSEASGDTLIPTAHIKEIRMGTTVATNALLERRGVPSALVVSRGFRDILSIGDQSRPQIFALQIEKTKPLPIAVVEARERVRLLPSRESNISSHETEVLEPLDEAHITSALQEVFNSGISSVAVCLMHSYTFADHEVKVGEIARSIGFTNVSLSTDLMPVMKYVPRATTASVDAYLTPLIAQYIANFQKHFERCLEGVTLMFVQSDGGLTSASSFFGFKAVLSGPAGGVVGCSRTAAKEFGPDVQVVGFDMGGTSTDVSRCRGFEVDHTMQANIAGTLILSPQVEVHTVAAGGGSVLKWENSMYVVGPESAGAFPGPACYGRGGPLTVTDANVMLGRIQPKYFPYIFGASANEPLNKAIVERKFHELTEVVNASLPSGSPTLTPVDVAYSFVVVANEAMSRPIRNLTEAKGHRADEHVLSVFGGAGGQHACGVANALGIRRIFLHRLSSYLSAVGIQLSDVVEDRLQASKLVVEDSAAFKSTAKASLQLLRDEAVNALLGKHPSLRANQVTVELKVNLRFEGTNTALATLLQGNTSDVSPADLLAAFERTYEQQFGFVLKNRRVIVDEFWARARGTTHSATEVQSATSKKFDETVQQYSALPSAKHSDEVDVYFHGFDGCCPTKVYDGRPTAAVSGLTGPVKMAGPAIILGDGSTVIVEPTATAYVTAAGNIIIETNRIVENIGTERQPLALSVFAHRFMSIAEQMGYTLQRTSISTNIKERLDFSCAIFDPQGNLVANAPHIPVHLGAMGAAVRWQRDFYGNDWREGDVMLSNHPRAGGSHLPDITVMTACFHNGKVVFYVASRGHHADVGGTTPGSMPPFSRSLLEEGAAIKTLRLVQNGVFNEVQLREVLMEPGQREGMSGCRLMEDCVSDLKAQVAANQRGVQLVRSLIADYGLDVVQAYMSHIQSAAEEASREVLKTIAVKYGSDLSCEDFMDDGTAIRLHVNIDPTAGSAVLDFRGSDPQVLGSTNCPTAVVHSAVIYCIRCLVGSDIPLNQGCLAPVTILVKDGSILAPDEDCAVVAGNVLTSQRVTDVIFMALKAVACSQGCMNNLTFGDKKRAYYETICGGSGAGPTFDGASCVQTHMTNTRITDPEILESRYPVLLAEFEVRRGSGGSGVHSGGDGCKRSMIFLESMTTSISSERRVMQPRGLHGGENGTRGLNMIYQFPRSEGLDVSIKAAWMEAVQVLWSTNSRFDNVSSVADWKKNPRNIGGKNTILMLPGDLLRIFTPGGGGYGSLPNA
jgi:5-oxoprolinase (ATP-hydrolysing)